MEQLSESASALKRTEFRTSPGWARNRCAVDADPVNEDQVLARDVVQQVTGAAAGELDGALRQQPGGDDQLRELRGQVRGLAGRLDQARHPGQERTGVGITDVSTLGKIDVQGPDAARFLDFIYANTFSTLAVGRARYGIMLR